MSRFPISDRPGAHHRTPSPEDVAEIFHCARPPELFAPDCRGSLPEDDATRALYPMADGCLDYFPNALAEVSKISYEGNLKHNPGEPMHWNRGKSLDHRNKIIRHTVESKPATEQAIYHAAQAAWRALAELQQKIEDVRGVPMAPGARAAST